MHKGKSRPGQTITMESANRDFGLRGRYLVLCSRCEKLEKGTGCPGCGVYTSLESVYGALRGIEAYSGDRWSLELVAVTKGAWGRRRLSMICRG